MTDQATDIFAETWVLPQDELAVRRKSPPRGQELARRIERLLATDDARKEQPEPYEMAVASAEHGSAHRDGSQQLK